MRSCPRQKLGLFRRDIWMSTFVKKSHFGWLSRGEKVVIGLCLIGIPFFMALAISADFQDMIFGFTEVTSSQPRIGRISYLEQDARHKNIESIQWRRARKKQGIHLNDSVFTGKSSRATIVLDDGPEVNMGENSLVTFPKINGQQFLNLDIGNHLLTIDKPTEIMINNKITKLDGVGSEVQIYIDKQKKSQLRVVRGGEVSVSEDGKPARKVKLQEVITLQDPQQSKPIRQPASHEAAPLLKLTADPGESVIAYTRRLYDVYEMNGSGGVKRRLSPPSRLSLTRYFQSKVSQGQVTISGHKIHGEISSSPSFEQEAISFQSNQSVLFTKEVFPGENYWRISLDGKLWSETFSFKVESKDLDANIQISREHQGSLVLSTETVRTSLAFQPSQIMRGFILESSMSPDFPDETTQVHWLNKSFVGLSFKIPGRYYYRVRGVNAATELTAPSETEEIIVEPAPPRRLAGAVIKKPEVKSIVKSKPSPAQNKTTSASSKPKAAQSQPPIALKNPEPPRRQPTSVSTSSLQAPQVEQGPINQGYSSSKLELETGAFTVYSPDESDVGRKNPMALVVGIRSHHWFGGRSGVEAALRVKAANGNETAEGINPLQLEARYLYKLNPDAIGRTQFSAVGGLEMYRNIGRGYFAQKYDLAKVGLSLDLPVLRRWDMGGEVLYGLGADSSNKYEIAGRVNYYLQKDWSFGVGYRLHHFKAGSEKTAPLEFPYKETYGEGYSVLQWHY